MLANADAGLQRFVTFCRRTRVAANGCFRTLFSTCPNKAGWNADAIEKQLAHEERDEVRGAYDRAQWMSERAKLMQWWADRFDALREEAQAPDAAAKLSCRNQIKAQAHERSLAEGYSHNFVAAEKLSITCMRYLRRRIVAISAGARLCEPMQSSLPGRAPAVLAVVRGVGPLVAEQNGVN